MTISTTLPRAKHYSEVTDYAQTPTVTPISHISIPNSMGVLTPFSKQHS
jgi:hypothetical protein